MKFVWEELYDGIQSIVSRCWLDVNGHGLPPTYTPVLAACEVDNNRTVYAAMVDQSGEWLIPEFQGDPRDVTVLMWMPKPQISMRVDTAFALNSDMLEAVTIGINKEAELATRLAAMTARAEAAEAASRQRCLTYTEAKKIVKAWRQDFACNVSEEYIINAFLDDAIGIRKLRAELATTQSELANTQLRLDSWLEALAIQRQRSETAEAALQLFKADERDLQEAHYEIETLRAALATTTAKRAKEDAIHDAKIGDRLKIYLAAATARAEAAERKSEDLIIVAPHVSDYAGWLQKDLSDANARIAELDAKLDAVRSIVATAAGIESLDNAAVEVKVQP